MRRLTRYHSRGDRLPFLSPGLGGSFYHQPVSGASPEFSKVEDYSRFAESEGRNVAAPGPGHRMQCYRHRVGKEGKTRG